MKFISRILFGASVACFVASHVLASRRAGGAEGRKKGEESAGYAGCFQAPGRHLPDCRAAGQSG